MRRMIPLLMAILLAGCGPALTLANRSEQSAETHARFQADLDACGGWVQTPYVYPVILAPVILPALIHQARARACMKERGWVMVPP